LALQVQELLFEGVSPPALSASGLALASSFALQQPAHYS
jgi:hypothetical protein